MRKLHIIILSLLALSTAARGAEIADSTAAHTAPWDVELRYEPSLILSTDRFVKKWLKSNKIHAVVAELHHHFTPADSNAYDKAYHYPTLSVGIRYSLNHDVRMHREADPDWGQLVPVDYDTQMGNSITLYGTFERPLLRWHRNELDTYIGTGIGYSRRKYNTRDQIDNELIGSHFNIFFTTGIVATWYLAPQWNLRTGIDFSHHSNGSLHRPNKGANYLGPFVGIVWKADRSGEDNKDATRRYADDTGKRNAVATDNYALRIKHYALDLGLAVGAKTLEEDWHRTQFGTPPDQPDYRTSHFRLYPCYAMRAALLYQYGITRATGAGIDVQYGTYSDRIRDIDRAAGSTVSHSPWSVGISARHHVFFRSLSMRLALGYYLYRHMGERAREVDKPYYERIGLHYSFSRLRNLTIGFNVNAHLFKADFTELQVSFPVKL